MCDNGSAAAVGRGRAWPGHGLLAAALMMAAAPAGAGAAASSERELALTIYRQDTALVEDRREIPRAAREQQLVWPEVAPSLQPDTVRLSGPSLRGYRVRHQPLAMAALLERYVGRTVGVEQSSNRGRSRTDATLVSADPTMVEIDGAVRSVDPAALVFPEGLPPRMGEAPVLELELARGSRSGTASDPRRVTVSYLASGISWSADYVAMVAADGRRMDLLARARIANHSGMDITEARAELIAGQPAVPKSPPEPRPARMMMRESADTAAAAAAPEPMGHLQRFRLDAPVTLADGERYSRRLFARRGIAVERTQVLRSSTPVARAADDPGWQAMPLRTELAWTSTGVLPAGVVRVYRDAGDGPARFVGGARIADRPQGQRVTIEPGQPFEVTARRRQTDYERLGERSYAVAHAIELHNGGPAPATVRVEERIPGDWRITDASESWERAAAQLAIWRIELAPGTTRELRYRARVAR